MYDDDRMHFDINKILYPSDFAVKSTKRKGRAKSSTFVVNTLDGRPFYCDRFSGATSLILKSP